MITVKKWNIEIIRAVHHPLISYCATPLTARVMSLRAVKAIEDGNYDFTFQFNLDDSACVEISRSNFFYPKLMASGLVAKINLKKFTEKELILFSDEEEKKLVSDDLNELTDVMSVGEWGHTSSADEGGSDAGSPSIHDSDGGSSGDSGGGGGGDGGSYPPSPRGSKPPIKKTPCGGPAPVASKKNEILLLKDLFPKTFYCSNAKVCVDYWKNHPEYPVTCKIIDAGCPHPISRTFRKMAATYAFKTLIGDHCTYSILDYFGSSRNDKLFDSSKFTEYTHLDVHYGPYKLVAGDAARGFHRKVLPDTFDAFLIQDVYMHYESELSPEHLLTLCDASTSGKGIVITRLFPGYAGMDSHEYNEGLYYRTENQKIRFSPDPKSAPYDPHSDMSWLTDTRSLRGLAIADLMHFGPYAVIMVSKDPIDVYVPPSFDVREFGELDKITVNKFNILGNSLPLSIASLLPTALTTSYAKEVLIHFPTYLRKKDTYSKKAVTGILMDSAINSVQASFNESALCQRLAIRFPKFMMELTDNTAMAILYADKEKSMTTFGDAMKSFFPLEEKFLECRMRKVSEEQNSRSSLWIAVPSLLSLFYLIWKTGFLKFIFQYYKFKMSSPFSYTSTTKRALTCVKKLINVESLTKIAAQSCEPSIKVLNHTLNKVKGDFDRYTNVSAIPPLANNAKLSLGYVVNACLISPILEEFLRSWAPKTSKLMMWYEVVAKASMTSGFDACMSYIFHTSMDSIPSMNKRILCHTVLNSLICWTQYVNFAYANPGSILTYTQAIDLFRLGKTAVEETFRWKAEDSMITTYHLLPKAAETMHITVNGEKTSLDLAMVQARSYSNDCFVNNKFVYPICTPVTHYMPKAEDFSVQYVFSRPSTSPINVLCGLVTRTFQDPYHDTIFRPNLEIQDKLWKEIVISFLKNVFYGKKITQECTFSQAIAKMPGPKKKRLLNAMNKQLVYGSVPLTQKSVSIKHDEVILPKSDRGIKPRIIAQFPPEYLSRSTVEEHQIAMFLHQELCNEEIYKFETKYGEVQMKIIFASGLTQVVLNEIMDSIIHDSETLVVLVAGDDSLVYWGALSGKMCCNFTEADASGCDHTEKIACHKAISTLYRAIGVSEERVIEREIAMSLPYNIIISPKDFVMKITCDTGFQQQSGDNSTTNVNSLAVAMGNVHAVCASDSADDYVYHMLTLGYVMKAKQHLLWNGPTFLKGWWIPSVNGSALWYPLPSIILKLGKMLEDPRRIAKKDDFKTAVRECAFALASSPGTIPFDYPIVGPFLHKMKELGTPTTLELQHKYMRVQVTSTDPIDSQTVLSMLLWRYSITQEEVFSFEKLVDSITELPMIFSHSIVMKLTQDYA